MRFLRFFVLICVFALLVMNQSLFAQIDSSYIESKRSQIVPRLTADLKLQNISFTTKISDSTYLKSNFSAGSRFQIGGAISYQWINIGYSFSLNPTNSKQNLDLRLLATYRPLQVQFDFSYLRNMDYTLISGNYSGLQDTLISQREKGIRIVTAKLKTDYVFNFRKYSYNAGFSPRTRQLKSAGSFLVSGAIGRDRVSLSDLSSLAKPLFDSINGFNNVKINSIELGAGYGHNWVIGHHLTLAFIGIPKVGLDFIKARSSIPEKYFFTLGYVNHFKLGVVYSYNRFFTGFSAYNYLSISKIKNTNYSNTYTTLSLYCGWVFDVKRKRTANP